jgi:hypothetical protein
MAYDDSRVRKGQAYNLATADALKADRADDLKYIAQRFYFHLETAAMFQKLGPQDLALILERPGLIEKFKELNEELSK